MIRSTQLRSEKCLLERTKALALDGARNATKWRKTVTRNNFVWNRTRARLECDLQKSECGRSQVCQLRRGAGRATFRGHEPRSSGSRGHFKVSRQFEKKYKREGERIQSQFAIIGKRLNLFKRHITRGNYYANAKQFKRHAKCRSNWFFFFYFA